MALNLTKNFIYIKRINIYENETHFYFVGEPNLRQNYYIITFQKLILTGDNLKKNSQRCLKDLIFENKKEYTKQEFKNLLVKLKKKPQTTLNIIDNCYGIFGFVKFFLGYYAILINETSKIGKISKYVINRVDKFKYLPLFYASAIKKEKIYDIENK